MANAMCILCPLSTLVYPMYLFIYLFFCSVCGIESDGDLLKRKATRHFHACKPASTYVHLIASDRLHIIFAIIIDVLWIITRPIFEQ